MSTKAYIEKCKTTSLYKPSDEILQTFPQQLFSSPSYHFYLPHTYDHIQGSKKIIFLFCFDFFVIVNSQFFHPHHIVFLKYFSCYLLADNMERAKAKLRMLSTIPSTLIMQ